MKIGILTHQLLGNYGGILQNFALQEVLREMGHEPITIDYKKTLPQRIKVLSIIKRCLLYISNKKSLPLRGWPTKSEEKKIYSNTREFVDRYIATTKRIDIDKIDNYDEAFDALVIGSDQVWRYAYMGKDIKHFFGASLPKIPIKIAYAASYGTDEWEMPKTISENCKEWAKRFNAISVREDSGVVLCQKHLNVRADHVLDPTFLVSRERYIDVINRNICKDSECENKKLVTYILDNTKDKQDIVDFVSKKTNANIQPIAVKEFSKVGHTRLNECIIPPIEHWLKGIMNAKFVITDSFHGTAFSIIFNKPFITITNNSRGVSRMTSLLKIFNLENRLVNGYNEKDIINKLSEDIGWGQVNNILFKEKQNSLLFIHKSLTKQ